MARPKVHQDAKARRAAFLAEHDRFDLLVSKQVGETVRELATMFEASNSEVLQDLVRFALANRNWKHSGLTWSATRKDAE